MTPEELAELLPADPAAGDMLYFDGTKWAVIEGQISGADVYQGMLLTSGVDSPFPTWDFQRLV